MTLSRRLFMGTGAAGLAAILAPGGYAPAVGHAGILMPVRRVIAPRPCVWVSCGTARPETIRLRAGDSLTLNAMVDVDGERFPVSARTMVKGEHRVRGLRVPFYTDTYELGQAEIVYAPRQVIA